MNGIERPAVRIRPCESHDDLRLCVDLQRRIWGFAEEDIVPAAIFVVAQLTGGHAYCAFDGDRAVGFALAFSAEHGGRRVWHSHMVGVIPEYQNRGAGGMLKQYQRDQARRLGIAAIEWTFDPLELRNAHFNIAKLGVIVRHYIRDCYGPSTSPLHRGLPTDRFLAEWEVESKEREIPAGAVTIHVPTAIREWRNSNPERARAEQSRLRLRITELFSRGYAVTGFARGDETCQYILTPYED